jgi:hypothetical protein
MRCRAELHFQLINLHHISLLFMKIHTKFRFCRCQLLNKKYRAIYLKG